MPASLQVTAASRQLKKRPKKRTRNTNAERPAYLAETTNKPGIPLRLALVTMKRDLLLIKFQIGVSLTKYLVLLRNCNIFSAVFYKLVIVKSGFLGTKNREKTRQKFESINHPNH